MTLHVLCMKWGPLYGPHYVNRLHAMVRRHLPQPFRFVCFTDDPGGLDPAIEARDIPEIALPDSHRNKPWRKIALCRGDLLDGARGTALFLDLDLVVVDDLSPLLQHQGEFCIIHNWTRPDLWIGNSSVYRWELGSLDYVMERFYSRPFKHWHGQYRNSQTFLSNSIRRLTFWPEDWCVSFKRHCLPGGLWNWVRPARIPPGARIVVFHGHPNPDDAAAGRWPGGPHKRLRPVPWIARHWQEDPPAATAPSPAAEGSA